MDPNATLEELRRLVEEVQEAEDDDRSPHPAAAARLAELFAALDGWISGGGFLPRDWNRELPRVIP